MIPLPFCIFSRHTVLSLLSPLARLGALWGQGPCLFTPQGPIQCPARSMLYVCQMNESRFPFATWSSSTHSPALYTPPPHWRTFWSPDTLDVDQTLCLCAYRSFWLEGPCPPPPSPNKLQLVEASAQVSSQCSPCLKGTIKIKIYSRQGNS